jgi:methyl-accepting chemotaxis protein
VPANSRSDSTTLIDQKVDLLRPAVASVFGRARDAQTEKATGDITQQILSIELTTSQVVQAMKTIAGTIAQLNDNATDISVAVQQRDAVSKEIARSANAAAERTREVSASVVHVSDAATKAGELANAVLSAGTGFAARSDRLRAEVERFLAQVRVA